MTDSVSEGTSHSVLRLRAWLAARPLRLAPMWATLAGALSSGRIEWQPQAGLVLLAAIILTDGLWGQVWEMLVGPRRVGMGPGGSHQHATPSLPYVAPASAASNLWRWMGAASPWMDGSDTPPAWRSLVMAVVLSLGLAALLGPAALALTGVAFLLAALSRALRSHRNAAALGQACLEIGLAWLMGHLLFGGSPESLAVVILGGSYLLLHASALALRGRAGIGWINLAQLIPVAYLVAARQPAGAAAIAITLLAPLSWQAWMRSRDAWHASGRFIQQWAQIWWWAGMLISAWSIS